MPSRSRNLLLLALLAGATSSVQAGLISTSGSYATDPIGSTVDSTWQMNFSLSGGDDSAYRYFGSGGTGEIRTSGESTSYGFYQEDNFGADFSALLIDESLIVIEEPTEEFVTVSTSSENDGGSTDTNTATTSPSLTPVVTSTGQGGTSVSVPEPGTLGLTMLGLLGLIWSRKNRSLKNRRTA
jgi:hypothetical protein